MLLSQGVIISNLCLHSAILGMGYKRKKAIILLNSSVKCITFGKEKFFIKIL